MSRFGAVATLACLAAPLAACDSAAKHTAPTAAASTPAARSAAASTPSAEASAPAGPPSAVELLFRAYKAKLPPPRTLSEGNGASTNCASGGHATYNQLDAAGERVPIGGDADLPELVPWARDDDECIRQIALTAILHHISYDDSRLVIPNMHEVEHFLYHDILGALKTHLDQHKVVYAPKIFEGLMLALSDRDFAPTIHGRWEEEISDAKNFQYFVEVDGESLRVTHVHRRPDPSWPDTTDTIKIKGASVNDKRQFVVIGEWRVQTSTRGYRGAPSAPEPAYLFWPVKENVAWFDNGRPGSWMKLKRVGTPAPSGSPSR